MKRTILMTLVIAISFAALAQQPKNLFEQLTETYSNTDGFSASMLTSDIFDLYLKKESGRIFAGFRSFKKTGLHYGSFSK